MPAATRAQLKGLVVDGESGVPLSGASVINIQSQRTALTDATGSFNLSAVYNDQIAVTMPGYKSITRRVPFLRQGAELRIELYKLNYELEEFVFRPKYTPYQLDSMERRAVYKRALSRHKSSVASPVSWVAEKFSKNSKRIFRFQQNYNQWEDQKFIDTRYTPELVSQMTGLQGDTLAFFMNAYPLPYDFARAASDLEIKIWIRENYKAWIRRQPGNLLPSHDSGSGDKK